MPKTATIRISTTKSTGFEFSPKYCNPKSNKIFAVIKPGISPKKMKPQLTDVARERFPQQFSFLF
jgi:hypothetical protein